MADTVFIAVMVTYLPGEEFEKHARSLLASFDKMVIVDNTDDESAVERITELASESHKSLAFILNNEKVSDTAARMLNCVFERDLA